MDDIKEQVTRVLSEIIEDNELTDVAEIIEHIIKISSDINTKKFRDLSDYELLDVLIETQADFST